MADLMTVTGEVAAADLGLVLVHEHVRVAMQGAEFDSTAGLGRDAQVSIAVEKLKELLDFGVRTFVDPCPIELGRDVSLLRDVSELSGIQIVCATGFYHSTNGFGLPYYWRQRWVEEIAELYLDELHRGVGGTGVRPGIIKVATGVSVTDAESRCLRAAGLAAKSAGVAIITHTTQASAVPEQLAALGGTGVDPARCLIGHQDEQQDYATLLSIVERGHFVGFDRVGFTRMISDDHRADQIVKLIDDGFLDRICISMDHQCFDLHPRRPYWVEPSQAEEFVRDVQPERDLQTWGRSYTYLFSDFLPRLAARGLGEAEMEQLLRLNPRRLLTGDGPLDLDHPNEMRIPS